MLARVARSSVGIRARQGARVLLAAWLMGSLAHASASVSAPPLSIVGAIETTRAMADREGRTVFFSPNGMRYAILLVRGDVSRDGVWLELAFGSLRSLNEAQPKIVQRFFTRGFGRPYPQRGGGYTLTWPTTNAPVWLDDQRVGVYWEDDQGVRQFIAVDVDTGELEPLTDHATDVNEAVMSTQGTLLFSASVPCEATRSDAPQGTVVTARDAFELLYGCALVDRGHRALYLHTRALHERRVLLRGGDEISHYPPRLAVPVFSADGSRAIVAHTVADSDIPAIWREYQRPHLRNLLAERETDRLGGYARQLQQLFVVDVEDAAGRPLWSVPANAEGRVQVAWSPEGGSVLVGPTFLPLPCDDEAGRAGLAVAEVDIASGTWRRIPLEIGTRIEALRWLEDRLIVIETQEGTAQFRREGGAWRSTFDAIAAPAPQASVQVQWREDLNTPPQLIATDLRTRHERLVLDPNPNLTTRFSLGRVEWVRYTIRPGLAWEGRLYYPAHHRSGQRYPLVVQTHTLAGENVYSLYGKGGAQPALGPGGSVYIAQTLAGHGMFVLHGRVLKMHGTDGLLDETRSELEAIETVIERLAILGLIDRDRVGIMGHSASGWLASYAIAHGRLRFAAAIADDHKDGGYFQAALAGWAFGAGAEMIGAEPFDEGLEAWLDHSPALNAHAIRTPLLMTVSSDGLEIGAWEMFSRLRHLRKPVELFLVPNIEHGSHGLQNPTQIRALQERALDWWRFWLQDEQDSDPRKAAQYAGWRHLRSLATSH